MKKVLVLYYSSPSQQLKRVVDSFVSRLPDEDIKVDLVGIEPKVKYPYPWSFYRFASEFPEAVLMEGCEIKKITAPENDYDLVIIGYTIWFLSPSTPMVAFMKSDEAKKLLKGKPVVTLIACRDMWVMAQEKMKKLIEQVGAKLVDNVVLTDQGKGIYSFVTTPRWLLSGKKDAFWFFPPAGILQEDINNASRFGKRLNEALKEDRQKSFEPMLRGLGAVSVDGKLIASEVVANRSSYLWAKLIKLFGPKESFGRKVGITIYSAFLVMLVFTVIPLNIAIRKILNIFQKDKLKALQEKYEQPSGR